MSAQKTTNTPTLNGGDSGEVWILLFSEVTLFYNFVADCRLIFCYRSKYVLSTDNLLASRNCDFT